MQNGYQVDLTNMSSFKKVSSLKKMSPLRKYVSLELELNVENFILQGL